MKHLLRIILIALLFLPACLSWFLEKPTFTLKEVAITRAASEIRLLFGIEVMNPNAFDLKLRSLEYVIYFNDRELGQGRIDQEVQIAKSSSTLVQVPLQTDFRNLGNVLGSVFLSQNLRYKIEGVAIVKATLGSATIPISKTGDIKLKNRI